MANVPVVPEIAVAVKLETKSVVEVAFVVVAFAPVKFWRVEEPVTSKLARVPVPPARFVAKRFVDVAFDDVLFAAVKFCSVEEPFTSSVPSVPVEPERFVAKRFVEVAFELVELPAVKSCNVELAYAVNPWPKSAVEDA